MRGMSPPAAEPELWAATPGCRQAPRTAVEITLLVLQSLAAAKLKDGKSDLKCIIKCMKRCSEGARDQGLRIYDTAGPSFQTRFTKHM